MDACFVVVPHPMGMIPLDQIRKKAEGAFPEIMKAATQWKPKESKAAAAKSAYPAERIKFKGTQQELNDFFYKKVWSLGLQIVPPTPERVAQMLKGTTRAPGEIIGAVPPRDGILTVEMVAVYAVMAGCRPEYMPVLIAAAEAMVDPAHGWRAATTTTNPLAPLLVVSGPIVKELGIQYSTGALGGGPASRPNVTIGYAINLIGDVLGGSVPPIPDSSTLGQTANIIAMVLGENEAENPWEPFRVDMGFDRPKSTVTLFEVRSFVNNNLHDVKTGQDLLTVIGSVMGSAGAIAETTKPCAPGNKELLLLSPEHASLVFSSGFKTKKELQKFLFEKSQVQRTLLELRYSANPGKLDNTVNCFEGWKKWELIPLVQKPEDILIVVTGGAGKHSVYMSTNGYAAVTKEVRK
jgi:hypothetical protein